MKKIILLMFVIVTSFAFIGCKSAEDKIRDGVEEVNSTCPEEIDMGLTMTRAYYNGSNIVYEYMADENYYDVYSIGLFGDAMKQDLVTEIKSNADGRELIKLLKEAGKGIEYRYVGTTTGEQANIVIYPYEL